MNECIEWKSACVFVQQQSQLLLRYIEYIARAAIIILFLDC